MSLLEFNPTSGVTQVWSCGGGTQSAAIAALICLGKLPKPDLSIIVDTGREKSSTWRYLDDVLRPSLAKVGVEIHRVQKNKYTDWDLHDSSGVILIPAFTILNGQEGRKSAFCSDKWKRRVTMRWLREQGVERCDNWLGISCDELRRVRASRDKWLNHVFPLVALRIFRDNCPQIVAEMGWPKPPRSACWMCPNMRDAEWSEMKENDPEDFALAVQFDHDIRKDDPGLFLHDAYIPLDQVNFDPNRDNGILGCDSGRCFA